MLIVPFDTPVETNISVGVELGVGVLEDTVGELDAIGA